MSCLLDLRHHLALLGRGLLLLLLLTLLLLLILLLRTAVPLLDL
jgi:hypothetical protein